MIYKIELSLFCSNLWFLPIIRISVHRVAISVVVIVVVVVVSEMNLTICIAIWFNTEALEKTTQYKGSRKKFFF